MSEAPSTAEAGGRAPAGLRALVVDDEPPLVKVVSSYLEREGFQVTSAGDGERAVALPRDFQPDVIVLDLMLPGIDGIEACRQIRTFSDAYIVMLTARVEEIDRIVGLSTGADDYVTKPFSLGELMARVRAMLRRPRASHTQTDGSGRRRFGDLEVDPQAREVRVAGEPVELTKIEFDLLDALSAEPRVVFGRERLLARVWGGEWFGDDHVVDVHIANLRNDALGYVPPDVARHLDMAYNDATLISLGVAVGAAVLMALALSAVISARVVRPVRTLATAAQRIAHGSHHARVPARGSDELAQLAGAFNEMAASLDRAEQIRRQLLADVAHELRNPLATVESYVEALGEGVLPADEENWSAIRAETTRLNRLVNDLQRVSRAEAHQLDLHPTPIALDTLVQDAIEAAAPAYAAKGVTLCAELQPALVVNVDRERILEVLANLLANALRHTPSGGRVQASTRTRDKLVEIAITDTGEGIAPEHLDRIFERFYRVDPARARASGGTGIGLAIVRAIVEAHGGTITTTSDGIGHGATFTIRLPIDRGG